MDTMAKDTMFHSLFSTPTWNALGLMPNTSNFYIFMWSKVSCSTQRFHNSCALEPLTQHNIKILMCCRASLSTQTLNMYSCAPEPLAKHKHQILIVSIDFLSTQISNTHVPLRSRSTQISHQLCASGSMPNT